MTAAARYEIEEVPMPRTLGEHFIASKEYLSRDQHRVGDRYSVNLNLPFNRKAAGDPVTMVTTEAHYAAPRGQLATFLDLITEVPTSATTITFARETNFGLAVPVATAAAKTALDLAYSSFLVPVETIAAWIKVTVDALDDSRQAGFDITQRLRVAVTKGEEAQVVAGNGTTPNLIGMLSVAAGIASAAGISAGIAAVRGAGYAPNAILLNPANYDSARTAAATSYAYAYDPFRGVEVLYGVPVYASNAVPAGTGIVGDLANGCTIWRRQEATIIVGLVNDDITKNIVTIVGESRLAFYVTQPLALNKVTLT
jgi:HK97 family phage major capsid protein